MLLQIGILISSVLPALSIQIGTPLGEIKGETLTSRLGKTIYAFRGIRFAEPPTGSLRFKPPVPSGKWSGVYDATKDAPLCSQPNVYPIVLPIDEDCLFLNVYTTKLPEGATNPKRPVILFIFPGSFVLGGVHSAMTGPQFLMDHDVVLVTINYRLGSLGLFSIGEESPGNNGLRDQVLAMKWVRDNIEAFGGDPDSVTLYGVSAGSCSISLHLVSPMSRGLFHKAIMSGCSLAGFWDLPTKQHALAQKQARLVGCPDDSPRSIIDCLRTKPAQEIANTLFQFLEFGTDPALMWYPVVEEDFGQERFLVEQPNESLLKGDFLKVPVIAGVTKDEFAITAYNNGQNQTRLEILDEKWTHYAPIIYLFNREPNTLEISQKLRKFYFGDKPINNSTIDQLGQLYADAIIGFPTNNILNLLYRKTNQPLFYYVFSYLQNKNQYGIVPHAIDFQYVFHKDINNTPNSPDPRMIETLTSLWTSFAKSGKPSCNAGSNLSCSEVAWMPYDNRSMSYLDIGEEVVMKNNLYPERYRFWKELIPAARFTF